MRVSARPRVALPWAIVGIEVGVVRREGQVSVLWDVAALNWSGTAPEKLSIMSQVR
jgi:hypothetical protein